MALIVISVGTSLLTNNADVFNLANNVSCLKRYLEEQATLEYIQGLNISFDQNGQLNIQPQSRPSFMQEFSQGFFNLYLDDARIQQNVQKRTCCKDHCPAEISTLYLYYQQNAPGVPQDRPRDTVVLITTATPDALYCAKMIEVMIGSTPFFSDRCFVHSIKPIAELNVFEPTHWQRGLEQLNAFFRHLVDENAQADRRVLLRTGGYKEFSADLKLMAMKYSFESYYLFDRSTNLLRMFLAGGWPADFEDIIDGSTVA